MTSPKDEDGKIYFCIYVLIYTYFLIDGYTYERASIQEWLTSGRLTSPMTNAPLKSNVLTPNRMLKLLIQRHFDAFLTIDV